MNKQQLANKIWESANKMRSKIEANEYKDYILGFIFYKYLSDKEYKFLTDQGMGAEEMQALDENDSASVKYLQENLGYFIAYKDLFSAWLTMGKDFDVANVTDAISAFNRLIEPKHKKVFEGIFNTLETGLSKLGDSSGSRTKAISDLIHLIKDIPMDGKQDYDVLGFIYEYLISMFAANAGKKAGEFYTPHEVSLLMSEIVANHLKDRKEIKIYDPTSGSGSLLINIGSSVAKHMADANNIQYFAQELKQNTYNLTRMNLVMRGILPDNIVTRNGDTLEDDWPYFDESDPAKTYDPLYVDAVVSNPPYSQNWDPADKETDPRYARFGLAPKSKADYAFLLHDLYHLKPDGMMNIVLPHGVLFRGGEEGEIRKNLIEENHIDAIIGLPANIFFGTGIPTIVMVLRQKRENTDVLIVDASKGFAKEGKNNKLRACDIKRISDVIKARQDTPRYSRKVTREEIRQNEYNLNIPRYVDSSEQAESWDIYASMFGGIPNSELEELGAYWKALPGLRESLFESTGTPYTQLKAGDIQQAIAENPAVKAFTANYAMAFDDFGEYLRGGLLGKIAELSISKEETIISENIFARLAKVPLIDRYEAYQMLDDSWTKTAQDLEILQTEGFAAAKKVDPHMVLKKKAGKEEEVQEGHVGHVIPFELAQKAYLAPQLGALEQHGARLTEIGAEYEEILDSLGEDDKSSDAVNEDGTAFVPAMVLREAKRIRKEYGRTMPGADTVEAKLLQVEELLAEEKRVKAQVKKETDTLHEATRRTIENLTDAQAEDLLAQKWIEPLVNSIGSLPEAKMRTLTEKIKGLAEKYAVTYAAVAQDIAQTERELSAMMEELTGSEYDMKGLDEFRALLQGE